MSRRYHSLEQRYQREIVRENNKKEMIIRELLDIIGCDDKDDPELKGHGDIFNTINRGNPLQITELSIENKGKKYMVSFDSKYIVCGELDLIVTLSSYTEVRFISMDKKYTFTVTKNEGIIKLIINENDRYKRKLLHELIFKTVIILEFISIAQAHVEKIEQPELLTGVLSALPEVKSVPMRELSIEPENLSPRRRRQRTARAARDMSFWRTRHGLSNAREILRLPTSRADTMEDFGIGYYQQNGATDYSESRHRDRDLKRRSEAGEVVVSPMAQLEYETATNVEEISDNENDEEYMDDVIQGLSGLRLRNLGSDDENDGPIGGKRKSKRMKKSKRIKSKRIKSKSRKIKRKSSRV